MSVVMAWVLICVYMALSFIERIIINIDGDSPFMGRQLPLIDRLTSDISLAKENIDLRECQ